MPTIVMHQIKPMTNAVVASSHPKKMIQRIFRRKLPAPPEYSIVRPKGHRINPANFMHWMPTGMPIMVTMHKSPTIAHSRASMPPPNMTQSILPIVFIFTHTCPSGARLCYACDKADYPASILYEKKRFRLIFLCEVGSRKGHSCFCVV